MTSSKQFPRYWLFVGESTADRWISLTCKGRWLGALMFSLICTWTNIWTNNRETGDLRRHVAHCDVTVMTIIIGGCLLCALYANGRSMQARLGFTVVLFVNSISLLRIDFLLNVSIYISYLANPVIMVLIVVVVVVDDNDEDNSSGVIWLAAEWLRLDVWSTSMDKL